MEQEINEKIFSRRNIDLLSWVIFFSLVFNSNTNRSLPDITEEKVKNYVEHNIITNNNLIKRSLLEVKNKVMKDNTIKNKKEVLSVLDSTYVLYKKNDIISNEIISNKDKNTRATATKMGYKNTFIYIISVGNDFTLEDLIHEYSHIVDYSADRYIVDELKYDFNKPFSVYGLEFTFITNREYRMKVGYGKSYIDYLKDDKEIYARVNGFKYFLYRNNILKSPNDEITKEIIQYLFTGSIFRSLTDEEKDVFIKSDFIKLLLFIDLNEYPEIRDKIKKYQINRSNFNRKYESFDPHGGLPISNGPYNDFEYNNMKPRMGNPFDNASVVPNGRKIEDIESIQRYPKDIKGKRMKRKKERKRLMKFKEFEGAGFGSTDYRNVTGNATTSGYLFDNQPIGKSGGNIAMNIPRSNYYEPTTFILGQETEIIEDPYFNYKKIRRKDRKRKKDKELERKSKKFNDLYKDDIKKEV